MSTYKLIYFNGRGRAELARYIFAQAGQQYEDQRLTVEEFGKMKPSLWTGSLPVLEIDGKPLSGSRSISRFLAERFDLAGSNDFENAQLDSIIDVLDDLELKIVPIYFGSDEAKAMAKKALLEEYAPKYFGILEKRITENACAEGWILGKKMTYADMRVSLFFGLLAIRIQPSLADSFPAMKKLSEAVNSQPKIAEWIKNRPESPF